ncbi:MAG TPA: twin-arginine translocase TatA/TatE family subunit [Actinomycetota bacterium]|nr:twin-arginine translocase TatA/TatE family subunit [Actinomycetota bacterium]
MLNIGPQELIVILIIALLVVGPQRLPELSRQIGKGLRELRKIQDDVKDMVKLDLDASDGPPAGSPTVPGAHRVPPATDEDLAHDEEDVPPVSLPSLPSANGEAPRPTDHAAEQAE